ncbi:NAD(P)H-dependent oxidoreductase [Agrobacterium vitis]|uniref:NAD(P)H-dependent oxidoreductase n=1 Tax=Agrobacterium vitis TaxID=373 RepID=UPI001574CDD3|nr:NAD(P)H-dependent oxidoreductase [Agrobacterium vitis]NSY14912.1 NAD(P)H-dependent oxidoreductase [Agrobacterium vitis]NSY24669.1 NAD(P)H-dependent oxidoreductase [Agrobacterium vitis]WEO75293.1 NAD(P)H-dependent oxidoreductase [Agrobacterium vitis]
MHLLTVFSHPFADKYPAAVMDAFHEPFRQAGYSVDILDLHQENFDPRFTREDHAHFWGGPVPDEIAAMHHRVETADRLAFVFPVYWWGMPAMMKGWIERVFTGGWAYQFGAGVEDRGKEPPTSLLGNIPTTLIGIAGSTKRTYDKYGYGEAMKTQIDVGTFAYCGLADVESHLIYDVEGDHNAPNRTEGFVQVREIAKAFLSPERMVKNAKEEHLRAGSHLSRSLGA